MNTHTDYQTKQHTEAAQRIRQDLLTLLANENRPASLYAAIRNRLLDAAAEVETVIEMYQEGEER